MANGKKYVRKTKRTPKPRVPRVETAVSTAVKAYKLAKYMHGMINCEKKYHNFVQNTTTDYGGYISCLSNMGQGDTDSTRDGTSILARSVYFNANITMESTQTTQDFRIIMFVDKNTIKGVPITVADLLQVTGSRNVLLSPYNQTINGRIKVLRDWKFNLDTAKSRSKRISEFIKIYLHPKFTGASSADFDKDHIFICVLASNPVGSSLPTVDIVSRLGYYDN